MNNNDDNGIKHSFNYEITEDKYYTSGDTVNQMRIRENIQEKRCFSPFDMPVTIILLIANVLTYLFCVKSGTDSYRSGGLNIDYILVNKEYQRLLSYMFLHSGMAHLANNMLALYLFGKELEQRAGSVFTFIIYVFSGIAGGICSMYMNHLLNPDMTIFCVGASGALFGVMSATVVMRFRSFKSGRISGFIISISYILLYAVLSIGSGVDFWCHLGGGIAGAVVSFIILYGRWQDYDESSFRKIAGSVVAAAFCIIVICFSGIGKDVSALPDERVDYIKEQTVPNHPDRNIGEYFDEKFQNIKWEGFVSEDYKNVAQFDGEIFYQSHFRDVIIQFILYDNNSSYKISYVGIEDIEVSKKNMNEFLEYLFD